MNLTRMVRFAPLLIVAIMLGVFLWGIDFLTLQGEWTIYTVECIQGTWSDNQCTGKLAASGRTVTVGSLRRR